jgi:DNA-binding response OmpR family regulator
LGADDNIVNPFSPKELVARVRAVLRRSQITHLQTPAERVQVAHVRIDAPRMRVQVGDRAVELTHSEFQLLLTLAQQPGRLFTRAQLLDALRGVAFESYERLTAFTSPPIPAAPGSASPSRAI